MRMAINGTLVILALLYFSLVSGTHDRNQVKCNPNNKKSCPIGYCCVKEVYVSKDVTKPAKGYTVCKRLLQKDDFCLHNPEGYLCECDWGLKCVSMSKGDNFGHCRPS